MQYQKHHLVEKVTSKKKIRNLVFFYRARLFVCLCFGFGSQALIFFLGGKGDGLLHGRVVTHSHSAAELAVLFMTTSFQSSLANSPLYPMVTTNFEGVII